MVGEDGPKRDFRDVVVRQIIQALWPSRRGNGGNRSAARGLQPEFASGRVG